jgi:DNA-binding NarL/FixJ family response regulator
MTFRRHQHTRAGLQSWGRTYDRKPGPIPGKLTPAALAALSGRELSEMLRTDPASRRIEILRLHALGRTARQIADQLHIALAAVAAALRASPQT